MHEHRNGVEIDGVFYRDAECPKCGSVLRWNHTEPPANNGIFCPVCREHGYQLLGIIYFDTELLEVPFTTG